MAAIPFTQTSASTNLKAPDITRPGALFSSALKGLSNTAKQVGEDRVADAQNIFQQELSAASSSGDFSGVNPQRLNSVNANAAELQAAEASLKTAQLDVLGRNFQAEHEDKITNSNETLQRVIGQQSQEVQDLVTVDNGGNIRTAVPRKGSALQSEITQEQVNQASNVFTTALQNEGFQFPKTDRERQTSRRDRAKQFTSDPTRLNQIEEVFSQYEQQFNTLGADAQEEVSSVNTAYDQENESAKIQLETEKQSAINSLRITPEGANTLLQTKWRDVWKWVNTEASEDLGFFSDMFDYFSSAGAGAELKQYVQDKYQGKSLNGVPYQPWMIYEALEANVVNDGDGRPFIDTEIIGDGSFDAYVKRLARSKEQSDLHMASSIPGIYTEKARQVEAEMASNKLKALSIIKGKYGHKDTAANRRFYEQGLRTLQQAQEESVANSDNAIFNNPDSETKSNTSVNTGAANTGATGNVQTFPVTSEVDRDTQAAQQKLQNGGSLNEQDRTLLSLPPTDSEIAQEDRQFTAQSTAAITGLSGNSLSADKIKQLDPRLLSGIDSDTARKFNKETANSFTAEQLDVIKKSSPIALQKILDKRDTSIAVNQAQQEALNSLINTVGSSNANANVQTSPVTNNDSATNSNLDAVVSNLRQQQTIARETNNNKQQEFYATAIEVIKRHQRNPNVAETLQAFIDSDYYKKYENPSNKTLAKGTGVTEELIMLRDILLNR